MEESWRRVESAVGGPEGEAYWALGYREGKDVRACVCLRAEALTSSSHAWGTHQVREVVGWLSSDVSCKLYHDKQFCYKLFS